MDNEWLNLSETAQILGVHPATVRAWGDKGELPMQRTPGGHRRFRRGDVDARAAANQAQTTSAQIVIQNMLGRARLELVEGRITEEDWYLNLNSQARQEHAEIGRQLLNATTNYLCGGLSDLAVTDEARKIGQAYERLGRENELALTETTRAYLYFREFLSQTIYDMAQATGSHGPTDWGRIRKQIIFLANEVLVAIIAAHEEYIDE